MLTVNGKHVPVSSRRSDALRAYNARSNRLQVSTARMRIDLPKAPYTEECVFCSKCGKYQPVSRLAFWFEGDMCAFYQCAGGCK